MSKNKDSNKETHAPEIVYTSTDLYNYHKDSLKPLPYKGYTPNQIEVISQHILNDISKGLSTTQACNKSNIDTATLYRWCDKDPFLYASYIRACERLGVALFDRILDEVDSMHTVEDSIIASKKIDALKWLSGKLNQKFSDRSDVYINQVNNTLNASTNELSAPDRAKLMQTILSKLNGKLEGIEASKQLKE
jgi:hypothetical protein